MSEMPTLKKKDFMSDQEVRWCPGCGDYSILACLQMALPKMGISKEKIVFISGIGCSSRFPYYMDTYGMHTIHGRAPAFATGLKTFNSDLSVWVITGDGDGLSIGGNHFIHTIRRNVDINIILFNNEIYGLTKGQYSPTSQTGIVTKSTPFGSVDRPFQPASLAIGAEATFFARTIDTDLKHMGEIFQKAVAHKGTSVIEILQNCVIFNDKIHDDVTSRKTRDDTTLVLQHGKPMIYGKDRDKGIMLYGIKPVAVKIGENGVKESDILIHNEHDADNILAFFLSRFKKPDFPVPLGVFRGVEAPVYNELVQAQVDDVTAKKKPGSVADLLKSGDTWKVS